MPNLQSANKMKLRRYTLEDANQVIELFYDTIHVVNAMDYNEAQRHAWAPDKNPENYKRFCTRLLDNITYVVELDGTIIGFGDMSKEGYIDRLYTHKDYQRQGVAALIYRELEQDARELGLADLYSDVSITAKPALEKFGFKVIKAQEVVRFGVILQNYRMKKQL